MAESDERAAGIEGAADVAPVILVTGPVGIGKTTVAGEMSELLEQAGVPHAFVVMNCRRRVGWG